jgi:ribosomal-protein-alanine N-acetyltransferase
LLTTERLVIRPFRESDYRDLYEYLSLPETYLYEPGEPITLEQAEQLALERAKGTNFWAVILKETGKMIGHISFFQEEPRHFLTWEIGFIFNPAYQNKGYATEASRAVIKYAFKELGAHRIVGNCDRKNTASWRVLEKCGMKREGARRKNAYFHLDENWKPRWVDSYMYAILAEDCV